MAKKINFKTDSEVNRAHAALLDFHIEHVVVEYPNSKYIVVLNRFKDNAISAFEKAGICPSKIKNQRHYEWTALNHKHYEGK